MANAFACKFIEKNIGISPEIIKVGNTDDKGRLRESRTILTTMMNMFLLLISPASNLLESFSYVQHTSHLLLCLCNDFCGRIWDVKLAKNRQNLPFCSLKSLTCRRRSTQENYGKNHWSWCFYFEEMICSGW